MPENDLLSTLNELLGRAVGAAFGEQYGDIDPILRPAQNPKFGDYQANLAMALAKQVKQKPREVAEAIVAKLREDTEADRLFETIDIAGPGFINLRLTAEALDHYAAAMLDDDRLGVPAGPAETVVVDYSGPNVAKEMHVGHLRSSVIGDAIARVLTFQGYDVIRQNHLGDWGTQFGMLIEYLADTGWTPGSAQEAGATDTLIGDLNRLYREAKQKFDADADFADRSRKRVVALQAGDAATVELWRDLVAESKHHFNAVYERLGVSLTDRDVRGESFYNDLLPGVIEGLDTAGLLEESQGAAVVFLEGYQDREGEPLPLIVRKGDGGYLYATTDLAAARYRVDELGARRVIYVTDARQSQHFAMVFATLRKAGWADDAIRLDHVAFGTVLGPDRKPFKTRSGDTVRLADLLDEAERRAEAVLAEKNTELSANERQEIAHVVGIGALKYADLSNDRIKDYVFDWDRMLAFDGNTAPYLQNAYVRIRSIFRKGQRDADHVRSETISVLQPTERALVLKLLQWPTTVAAVADSLEPHRLCTFLYELASAYHQFYEQCPVLSADEVTMRESRLALCELVARTLRQGLDLLGIDVVEQM
ncbi:arginine--tRNA ligase [Phycisphaerales bacterium AB-hyl4]|uniref:Arginine--tRNA ligase n=1 Tax=Natronomicrosphaera hydrolytica TaxID=3242702 RepID=A0ABV4U4C8_9BACT